MTIEEFIIDYLGQALGESPAVPVSGSAPHPLPAAFVTVEKTGESEADHIRTAQIHIDAWSTSRAAADALCARVRSAMAGITALPEISRCALNTSYNNPSLENGKPRYSATFAVVYFLKEE